MTIVDIAPLTSLVQNPVPSMVIGDDQATGGYTVTRTPLAPGFFMYITKLDG